MDLLPKLSPAETLLLTRASFSDTEMLFRMTFFELMLRGVLDLRREAYRSHSRDPYIKGNLVYPGSTFHKYDAQPFEALFLPPAPFRILLRSLIYRAAKKMPGGSIQTRILGSEKMSSLFRQNRSERPFGIYRYSREGKILRKKLKDELELIGENVWKQLSQDPVQAIGTLNKAGGNLLLVKGFDVALLNAITPETFQAYCKENPGFDPNYFQWKYWRSYPTIAKYFKKVHKQVRQQIEDERWQWSGSVDIGGWGDF